MSIQRVNGTNCYNCLYISKESDLVDFTEVNEQGGIDPHNDEEMARAEKADLITLPGGSKEDATDKRLCTHAKIRMHVTARMCCAYWDNLGARRPWKQSNVKQWFRIEAT